MPHETQEAVAQELFCHLVSAAAQVIVASQLVAQHLEASQLDAQVAAAQLAYVLVKQHSGIGGEGYGGFQQGAFLVVLPQRFDSDLALEVWLTAVGRALEQLLPPQGAEGHWQLGALQ